MMKRVFALMLAFVMMFALSAVAMAEADVEAEAPAVEAEVPAAEPETAVEAPAEEPEAPADDPSESVDVPAELPDEEASSISRPRPTNPPKTSQSTSGKKTTSSAGQSGSASTGNGLTDIEDGEVPLYGGMQTGDESVYAAAALAMMSVLLLAGAAVCKARG